MVELADPVAASGGIATGQRELSRLGYF
jgi:hypothetical protein